MPRKLRVAEALCLVGWATGKFLARASATHTADLLSSLTHLGLVGAQALRLLVHHQFIRKLPGPDARSWVYQLNDDSFSNYPPMDDPLPRWNQPWDKKWRLLNFDIPSRPTILRQRLSRWLHRNRLGNLQHSVWICPTPPPDLSELFSKGMDPHTLLLWESSTPHGIRPVDLVKQAWDFLKINESYELVIQRALQSRRPEKIREATLLWHRALAGDPLLPRELYPKDYLGFKTMDVLRKVWLKHISGPS